jgi:hypothetical protein
MSTIHIDIVGLKVFVSSQPLGGRLPTVVSLYGPRGHGFSRSVTAAVSVPLL